MALADERGIEAVTMRELGRELGVEAASLYNHVTGKDDLLDGMVELVVAEIDVPGEGVAWREAMRRRAISAREVFARHRWAAALHDSRDRAGANSLSYVDRVLGVLISAGFPPAAAANAFLVMDSYIYGFERRQSGLAMEHGPAATEAARNVLTAIPEGAYPNALRVAAEFATTPFDQDAAFAFGLGLILDGLERLLPIPGRGRSATAAARPGRDA
jgi:AcrR family transcriptional regulator